MYGHLIIGYPICLLNYLIVETIYPWLIDQNCCSLFRSAFTITVHETPSDISSFLKPLMKFIIIGDPGTDSGGEGKSKRAGKNVKNGLKEI